MNNEKSPRLLISQESVLKARQSFADDAQECIEKAKAGEIKVNNLTNYITEKERHIKESLRGDYDGSFSFWQRAYYIQAGQSVPFLPNEDKEFFNENQ